MLNILQTADIDYPMALKEQGVDFALDHRHLWAAYAESMGNSQS